MEVQNIQFESLLFHTLVCKQMLAIVIKKTKQYGTGLKTDT